MKKYDLLQRAYMDLTLAQMIVSQPLSDELHLDMAAYHTQQALEKTMKYKIDSVGETFPFVHEIDVLYSRMEELGLNPPEWIWDNYTVFNNYATKTRYGENLVAVKRGLLELLAKVEAYCNDVRHQQEQRQQQ